eukprot:2148917-Prymnesium_polylepis.1
MVALAMPAPPKCWGRRAWRSARTRSGRGEQPAPASDSNEWATRASTRRRPSTAAARCPGRRTTAERRRP